jgi:glycosyltransferase involved in cell wall biosynthesis
MWITEAAACGTPSVATRIPGHLDAIIDGESGLLVDQAPQPLGDAISRVLRDDALRASLTEGALRQASRFTWDATALGILRSLADEATSTKR